MYSTVLEHSLHHVMKNDEAEKRNRRPGQAWKIPDFTLWLRKCFPVPDIRHNQIHERWRIIPENG